VTHLLAQAVLHADETTVQVLREDGRGGENPRDFLGGFRGYLHVDGYPGYHKVASVILVGCWAHARRKFDDALGALPDGKEKA